MSGWKVNKSFPQLDAIRKISANLSIDEAWIVTGKSNDAELLAEFELWCINDKINDDRWLQAFITEIELYTYSRIGSEEDARISHMDILTALMAAMYFDGKIAADISDKLENTCGDFEFNGYAEKYPEVAKLVQEVADRAYKNFQKPEKRKEYTSTDPLYPHIKRAEKAAKDQAISAAIENTGSKYIQADVPGKPAVPLKPQTEMTRRLYDYIDTDKIPEYASEVGYSEDDFKRVIMGVENISIEAWSNILTTIGGKAIDHAGFILTGITPEAKQQKISQEDRLNHIPQESPCTKLQELLVELHNQYSDQPEQCAILRGVLGEIAKKIEDLRDPQAMKVYQDDLEAEIKAGESKNNGTQAG